ncbi:precorrin-3B C(17)-methyltransferase [Rhodocyclus tenuis]|uniref:Precorrin-3B methylase n=1 Tax=Rhodocyclus tenuis TaxID=1066 RepID=A0A840GB39_RHOTE|nr:precorrin-3B C(17)-methyltransferase [Rhodocyclus tenuis]MBB4249085.1 precorrin-3B methylase [Rhodocyclus tenuis]
MSDARRGRLSVVGLGPGSEGLLAPDAAAAFRDADDLIGYFPYVDMAVRLAGPLKATLHASDNRVEMDRARHAFDLAASGRKVVVVSSGDPGIFAMATAVIEALHAECEAAGNAADNSSGESCGDFSSNAAGERAATWRAVELVIVPGISAAQAAASRVGAPLGHDFCVLSLSDNLKPWELIERRLELAASADLVLALYNPISKARPWQLGRAFDLLRRHLPATTPVVLGRDVGRPAERLIVTTLGEVTPAQVDMRTVVIVGSSQTRAFPRGDGSLWVYTPRWYEAAPAGEAGSPEASGDGAAGA